MFKRVGASGREEIILEFEGTEVTARAGDTVAAALLAADINIFRETPQGGRPRGPFCMMGVCFDCLMVIDGQPNAQACQIIAREGMKIARQHGAAVIAPDGEAEA